FPFGMLLSNTNIDPSTGLIIEETNDYRYAFNGGEKDNELREVEASHYDLGLRHYDPRIGRMMSRDPRASEYPWQTVYAYHRNSPIRTVDFMGGGEGNDP